MNALRHKGRGRWGAAGLARALLILTVGTTLAAGCGAGLAAGATGAGLVAPQPAQLTDREMAGLLRALDDEYHAYALYGQVIADFGQVRPFATIQRAEAQHSAALVRLFERYGVPVPANSWPGAVPHFATVRDACPAGVEAEIANRALYADLLTTTDRADILTVYRALQRASEQQHLPAFQRCAGQ